MSARAAKRPSLGFSDAVLAGLARDGGLYVPARMAAVQRSRNPRHARPRLSRSGDPPADAVPRRRDRGAGLRAAGRAKPTRPSGTRPSARWCRPARNTFVLELFHGPTLAFKDVAMQLLARLMDHVLAERGQRATIVGATSGDTGGAAIDAFAGRDRTDIFILFPHGTRLAGAAAPDDDVDGAERPCAGHRRQFRRLPGPGEGHVQRPRLPRPRVAVGRQLDQLGAHHGADRLLSSRRRSRWAAPTGRSPSPCRPAISATSSPAMRPSAWACRSSGWSSPPTTTTSWRARWRPANTGRKGVVETTSPSMDIQVSSNFERLLFEASRPRRRRRCGATWTG